MISKERPRTKAPGERERSPFWLADAARGGRPMDERAMAIFQPDILIEPQFQATCRRRFHLGPEHVLMLAVLQDAVSCFQEYASAACKRKQELHRDAEKWILCRDRAYLFSFDNVCEALGFDADYLRQGLLRWRESAQARRRKGAQFAKSRAAGGAAANSSQFFPADPGR